MKTKLLLLACVAMLIHKSTKAQSIFNTNDSHVWYKFEDKLNNPDPFAFDYHYVHYFTNNQNSDTIINNNSYKKKYFEVLSNYYQSSQIIRSPISLIFSCRYDSINRKVYVVYNDSINEHLFYDFSKNINDTILNLMRMDMLNPSVHYTTSYVVKNGPYSNSCNEILLADTAKNSLYNLYWFNNIGSEFMFRSEQLFSPVGGYIMSLICHSDSTQPCYSNNCKNYLPILLNNKNITPAINIAITPNPTLNNFTIVGLAYKDYNYQLINTMGITVLKGYISNADELVLASIELPNGLYTILLQEKEKGLVIIKIIIIQN